MGALDGRVAIVTGSASGIGEAVARRFAAEGATVVVNSVSSVEAGQAIAESLPGATYVRGDVSKPEDVEAIIAAAKRLGRLDYLINNAGFTRKVAHSDIDGADLDLWKRIFEVNVFGTWLMCQQALPLMRSSGGGSIVNMSSIAGQAPTGSSIPYACSKAALDHQTRLLARVVGPQIAVNAIAPGLIETPWTSSWDDEHAGVAAITPLRRVGAVDDVAELTYRVAIATYMTGQVVAVDGGLGLVV